jgi:hypothetical protein
MGRKKITGSEVYEELKDISNKVRFKIGVEKKISGTKCI